jgi:phenylacetate-CoA ligase
MRKETEMPSRVLEMIRLWAVRSMDAEQLAQLQLRKLLHLVSRAYEEVPFYRSLYRGCGFQPEDLKTLDDLQRLPVVTKTQLRQAGLANIVAERFDHRRGLSLHTGGTTGEPFRVVVAPREFRTRGLVDFRCLLAMGFRPKDQLVVVGPGQLREPALHERLGFFRTHVIQGILTLEEQIRLLSKLKPNLLWCYPLVLSGLLHFTHGQLRNIVNPRILIVSSQMLDPPLRRMVEQDLQAEIFLSYASMETGRIAAECPAHEGLHVNADHVLLETLDGDNGPVLPGETGTVVLTTLNQSCMPLIRYRLGDLCAWTGRTCSCGSTLPLISAPVGRSDDAFRFAGGLVMSPVRFEYALRNMEDIRRFRVIQENENLIRCLIAQSGPWPEERSRTLVNDLTAEVPRGVEVRVELVDRIEDEGNKFKNFFSKVKGD